MTKGKRPLQSTPTPTDASSAVSKLVSLNFQHQFNRIDKLGMEEIDWPNIAADIAAGLDGLSLSYSAYKQLAGGVGLCSDKISCSSLKRSLALWREKNGEALIEDLREDAKTVASQMSKPWEFADFLSEWPLLRTNRELLDALISQAEAKRDGRDIDSALVNLSHMMGGIENGKRVLLFVVGNKHVNDKDLVARLIYDWAGPSIWGQLHYDLWVSNEGHASKPREVEPEIVAAASELRQLPLIVGSKVADIDLTKMSKESRAAWRRTLAASVATNEELRDVITEALLWYAEDREDLLAQLAAIEINGANCDAILGQYKDHPSRIVRLRTASALALMTGEPDPFDLIATARRSLPTPSLLALAPPRTWLGDARIEQMLENALHRAAIEMEDETICTVASGEETQVAILFERMRNACRQVNKTLTVLAHEMGDDECPEFKLERRIVGKHEEGGEGLHKNAKAFSTDICLVMRAERRGEPPFAERACLIQAKRLHRSDSPLKSDYYQIDLGQVRDISSQTASSFLLLVGPGTDVVMPIIPARLFLDCSNDSQKTRRIRPEVGARLGRSLSSWLVYEVIGLWTGDPNPDVVKRAHGKSGAQPTMLIELKVVMVPTNTERQRTTS